MTKYQPVKWTVQNIPFMSGQDIFNIQIMKLFISYHLLYNTIISNFL